MYLRQVAAKYVNVYHMVAKEEKITIISAHELTSD